MFYPKRAFIRRSTGTEDEKARDPRSPFARDRDRLLYSSAFRSLAGKSQVVASTELGPFHTRLTHSLKVAQLGRRLAEEIRELTAADATEEESDSLWDVRAPDPDLIEFACLAHDLGHPPFGHAGEAALHHVVDALVADAIRSSPKSLKETLTKRDIKEIKRCLGGFEGNPQSFRILTRLSHKATPKTGSTGTVDNNYLGLDLTAASVDAVSKYPWGRESLGDKKWGAYGSCDDETSDLGTLKQAREGLGYDDPVIGRRAKKSFECELMEWCDDVTYAVHDVEDFHMIGMIPLEGIFTDKRMYDATLSDGARAARKAQPPADGEPVGVADTLEWVDFRSYVIEKWQMKGNTDYYGQQRPTEETYLDGLRFDLIWHGEMTGLDSKPGSILALRMSLRRSSNLITWFTSNGVSCRRGDKPLLNLGKLKITECGKIECIEERCKGADCVGAERRLRHECDMLKELIRKYVIDLPNMNTQQAGQGRIIRDLVKIYSDVRNKKLLPRHYDELIKRGAGYAHIGKLDRSEKPRKKLIRKLIRIRVAADYVSSFTEPQAVALHRRLTGIELGGFRDVV